MSYDNIDDGRIVILRKPCRCEWCGERIEAGATAIKRTYKWDGEFTDERQHPECYADMMEGVRRGDDGFTPYSNPRPAIQPAEAQR